MRRLPERRVTVLDAIVASTRARLAEARREVPPERMRAAAERARAPLAFAQALSGPPPRIIAEVKLASPSAGSLGAGLGPIALADAYERNGAAAISVLTEPDFFGGSLDILDAVRRRTHLPILMKDFVLDEYQLWQARAHGADAILLIVALLDPTTLVRLIARAAILGLVAVVEVHDEGEREAAILAGASVLGVNNRDLRTFEVDLDVSRRLAAGPRPEGVTLISESGIRSRREIEDLAGLGYRGFLLGTSLVRSRDPGAALAGLLGGNSGRGSS